MKIAIEEKRWEKLTENEVEKLYQMARAHSKKEIFSVLFPRGLNGKELRPYWAILEYFDKMDLIWIERELNGLSIIDIHKLPELAQSIFLSYNPNSDFTNNQLKPEDNGEIKLSLKRKMDRTSVRQPEFSGCFDFNKDITLKKGVKYMYGGWINDDGSLYIKITPIDNDFLDSREVVPRNNNPVNNINL